LGRRGREAKSRVVRGGERCNENGGIERGRMKGERRKKGNGRVKDVFVCYMLHACSRFGRRR